MAIVKDESSAPFNMALATLERVNDILKEYSEVSVRITDTTTISIVKNRLANQLYIISVPLIYNDIDKVRIKTELEKLKRCFFVQRNQATNKKVLGCYADTEQRIDDAVELIQEILQKDKYFMPLKSDPRFGWAEKT